MAPFVEDRNGNIIRQIGDNDVLIDGGDRHPGNLYFLYLVEGTGQQRVEVVVDIVAAIHFIGGRFLERRPLTNNWRELDREAAIAATGRLFDDLRSTILRATEVFPEQPPNPATVMEILSVDDEESEVLSNNYDKPAEFLVPEENVTVLQDYDDDDLVVVPEEDVMMVQNDDVLGVAQNDDSGDH